jgi:hypothetical protein
MQGLLGDGANVPVSIRTVGFTVSEELEFNSAVAVQLQLRLYNVTVDLMFNFFEVRVQE